jgi:hypothetical protein
MEREVRRLEGLGQLGFDFCPPATVDESEPQQAGGGEVFLDAEPRELFVGAQRGWTATCAKQVWAGC